MGSVGVRLIDDVEAARVEREARAVFADVWSAYRGVSLPADLGDRWWPMTCGPGDESRLGRGRVVVPEPM
jgi:hypothetical protein